MNSNQNKTLYDYLLSKTKGNLTKHTVTYELQKFKNGSSVSFFCISITGVSSKLVEPEEIENGDILLAGDPMHFGEQEIFLDHVHAVDSERVSFSYFKVQDDEYYCSSDDGMYLKSFNISTKELTFRPPKSLAQQRIQKVLIFFQKHRARLGSNLSEQQIYDSIGEPTKAALWNEWYRLYPSVFVKKYQKNFFDEPDFPKINFKEGNDPNRNAIAPEHQL